MCYATAAAAAAAASLGEGINLSSCLGPAVGQNNISHLCLELPALVGIISRRGARNNSQA